MKLGSQNNDPGLSDLAQTTPSGLRSRRPCVCPGGYSRSAHAWPPYSDIFAIPAMAA
ncbi:MAG: hypothetical protein ACI9CA_000662 [Natronomonas sp.]|jgi:hypothetical protein